MEQARFTITYPNPKPPDARYAWLGSISGNPELPLAELNEIDEIRKAVIELTEPESPTSSMT